MGAAFFITLQRPIEGIDPYATNGKALARRCDELDGLAKELGVMPLGEFFSMSADEAEQLLDLGGLDREELDGLPDELQKAVAQDMEEINQAFGELESQFTQHGVPPEEWFEASEGLQSVRRLIAFLQSTPDRIASPDDVIADLEEIEQILLAAEKHGVRFHLSIDV